MRINRVTSRVSFGISVADLPLVKLISTPHRGLLDDTRFEISRLLSENEIEVAVFKANITDFTPVVLCKTDHDIIITTWLSAGNMILLPIASGVGLGLMMFAKDIDTKLILFVCALMLIASVYTLSLSWSSNKAIQRQVIKVLNINESLDR